MELIFCWKNISSTQITCFRVFTRTNGQRGARKKNVKEKLILTSSLRDVLANDTLWGIMGNEKIGENKKKHI